MEALRKSLEADTAEVCCWRLNVDCPSAVGGSPTLNNNILQEAGVVKQLLDAGLTAEQVAASGGV